LLSLGGAFGVTAATAATPSAASWQQSVNALRLPGAGCFTAQFPQVEWQSAPCQRGTDVPFVPATAGTTPLNVGNGKDFTAVSSGAPFQSVTGSFPSVSAGTQEKGIVPVTGTPKDANAFSLQLNSSFFTGSPACSGSKSAACVAWQQFIYATSPDPADPPQVFMQYWLLNYRTTCPTGWTTYSGDCYMSSSAVSTPALTAKQLKTVSLEGTVGAGGSDETILSTPKAEYAVSNPDSVLDLSAFWNTAEFGVFGDGNSTMAIFSAGTTLEVNTATNNGSTLAPICSKEGFSGETNNLNLVKTPQKDAGTTPGILSKQSNSAKSKSICVTSPPA
jgi:hypothetical protein